ncbi:hypothetical protein HMPREF1627_02840 [Actinomyces sp. S6-Spd3]|mgnify:FL=1|jgi:hypothetical protein|uniref:hypothetical protein n=1 Tax=unclassified Actinomyces TaxID=2609248 RepID=UPI0005102A34|nr:MULTISPECIES: hypothetical protein [unclassified Actinomyces]KGF01058.1 hypothetical protein HMPREF1627_02840 [Actinomyces sp. S6-Spd3]MDU1430519.1 hypothetical protein [Actinomyces sp.]
MQKTKEADQPKTHPSSGSVISMSGVISAVCAALMLVMFLLAFFSEIVGRGWATLLFVEAFAVYELPLGVVAFFVGLYALTASRAHGRRLWSLGGYAIAAVILIVLVNLMLAGEELFDRLMDIYIFYL